jgi:hypothetical protein
MAVDLIAEARQHIAAVHSALNEADIIDAAYHATEVDRLLDRITVAVA